MPIRNARKDHYAPHTRRAAVGPEGTVIGIDITEQMLAAARDHGRASHTHP
jgi:ubiquinone/menaquinone biosynthesis C-methylase UbiE